jgi:lauroyl/myristoyl acyltransferase
MSEKQMQLNGGGSEPGLFASLLAAGAITGSTRFRLFPVAISAEGPRHFVVRRDTGRMLETTQAGAQSIRLLRRQFTVDAVRGRVGKVQGCDPAAVDLMPLLECLLTADFVAAVGGRQVSARQPLLVRWRASFKTSIQTPLVFMMLRYAPVGVTLRVLFRKPMPDPDFAREVAVSMRRAPALAGREAEIEQLAQLNCQAARRYGIERLLVALLPPAKLDRWLGRRTTVSGTEHLDRALAGGRGAILSGLHVTSHTTFPAILAKRGIAHTLLVDGGEVARTTRQRIDDVRRAGYDYPIEVASDALGLLSLARALRAGKTVLILFDATATTAHDHLEVPFLGGTLPVPKAVAWLAWRMAAPVLPLSSVSQEGGRCHLTIRPPLHADSEGPQAECLQNLSTRLAATFERDVQAAPEHWLKWKLFRPADAS